MVWARGWSGWTCARRTAPSSCGTCSACCRPHSTPWGSACAPASLAAPAPSCTPCTVVRTQPRVVSQWGLSRERQPVRCQPEPTPDNGGHPTERARVCWMEHDYPLVKPLGTSAREQRRARKQEGCVELDTRARKLKCPVRFCSFACSQTRHPMRVHVWTRTVSRRHLCGCSSGSKMRGAQRQARGHQGV